MTRTTCALLLMGLIVVLSISRPAEAWVAYRSYGAGVYHGAGGSAAWGGGSGAYHSAYGGSASWSHGSGSASGAYGLARRRGVMARAPFQEPTAARRRGVGEARGKK